jgi:hypothetical protein
MDREATAGLVVVGYYLSEKKEHSLRSRDYLNERVEEGTAAWNVHDTLYY